MLIGVNRKARFNYEIVETLEAGVVLRGYQVKAIKAGKLTLAGSHVIVRGQEAFLVGAGLAPYQPSNTPADFDPQPTFKLLLNKDEIARLAGSGKERRLTIIPLAVYTKKRRLKLKIALTRGKKKFDKRHSIKERESRRTIERTLKRNL